MDDLEKKLFVQLDDDMPAQRANALEVLREHLQKAGRKFRDLVADLENGMPAAKAAELRQKLAEYAKANEKAQKNEASLKREVARLKAELKAALWVKANWKISGAVAAGLVVLVAGGWCYERYWSRSEAVNAGLRAAVVSAAWVEGWGEPVASRVGGEPWWLMFYGDIDASSYSDNRGNGVEMRCVHLYAAPAQTYSGQFFKPSPRNFLGWVSWPELAMQCKPSPTQKAEISR
jgi:hypothetical protein